jgi:hypothetical protein
MVKKVIDYATREIIFYRFVCNDPNIINTYCGSTLDFVKRKSQHRQNCNNENYKHHHYLIYKTIRDNGGWDNWRMLEIERKIVKDRTEASQQEQYWIEYYNAQMNMRTSITNKKEYRQKNKNKKYEYDKKHRDENKEEICKKKKEYYEKNKKSIYEKQKINYEQNKDKIKQYNKEYHQRKKELKLMSLEDKNIM